MPNHTANNFNVHGPTAEVLRFLENAKGPDSPLSFESLLPCPSVLRRITSPVTIHTQAEIDMIWHDHDAKKTKPHYLVTGGGPTPPSYHVTPNRPDETGFGISEDKPFNLGITQKTSTSLIKKYGANDWYQWAVAKWGTKWDCYDVNQTGGPDDGDGDGTSIASFYYETAWAPATKLWLTVSEEYPTLNFYHEYCDEGGGFVGSESIKYGVVVNEEELEWDSDDGKTLREGLGRYSEEDEDELVDG